MNTKLDDMYEMDEYQKFRRLLDELAEINAIVRRIAQQTIEMQTHIKALQQQPHVSLPHPPHPPHHHTEDPTDEDMERWDKEDGNTKCATCGKEMFVPWGFRAVDGAKRVGKRVEILRFCSKDCHDNWKGDK